MTAGHIKWGIGNEVSRSLSQHTKRGEPEGCGQRPLRIRRRRFPGQAADIQHEIPPVFGKDRVFEDGGLAGADGHGLVAWAGEHGAKHLPVRV